MEQNIEKLDQILRELHFADPSIDINDEKLKEIVSKMLKYKPEFENKSFKAELKREINREIAFNKRKIFDFWILKKIAYFWSGAVFSYAIFSVTSPISEDILNTKKPLLNPPITIKSDKEENVSKKLNNTKTFSEEKKSNNNENKISENLTEENTLQTKNEIKENWTLDKTLTTPLNNKEPLKIAKVNNSNISEDTTINEEGKNRLMEDSLTYMKKSLPDNSTSLDDISDYTDSMTRDTWFLDDTSVSNDSLWWKDSVWLMAMPIKNEFVSDDFIKDLETSTTNLLYSIRASELKIENDTLIITTSTQTDFDTINTPENLQVIKSYLEKSWFYYEVKVNLK